MGNNIRRRKTLRFLKEFEELLEAVYSAVFNFKVD
jgi:hypothetical protein